MTTETTPEMMTATLNKTFAKTLAQKLYIRPGYTIALLNAPKGIADLLEPLPAEVKIVTNTKAPVDLILQFAKSQADLEKISKELADIQAQNEETILWIAFPKIASKTATDLTRDKGWQEIYDLGYKGVSNIAIDSTWSALRFKRNIAKSQDELLVKQYDDHRAPFLPLYQQIATIAQNSGPDVKVTILPKHVEFSRNKLFAILRPTNKQLELTLRLSKTPLSARLTPTVGVGSGNVTHSIAITEARDIDKQLIEWIHQAYQAAA